MRFARISLALLLQSVLAEEKVPVDDIGTEAESDAPAPVVDSKPKLETIKIDHPKFKATSIVAPFLEQFTESWAKRWIPSTTKKVIDGVEDNDLLQYRGKWNVEEGAVKLIENDMGLVLKTLAAHSAIAAKFDKPIDPTGKDFVVQYDVKFQNGLECGGAYMKLLTFDKEFDASKFNDKTPYTIMFGPDKCGGSSKIHFIFRHKNSKSGVIEEKHLIPQPPMEGDEKETTLYTLVVKPDQTFKVQVNGKVVKAGSLLEDFTPPVNPPKEIPDPDEVKPTDWVDLEKIPDPAAVKPEDWDEDAPKELPDMDAKQPEDWLVDEPATVPDATVVKPEDWDDEEDGDWVAPSVPNPKCTAASGCGEWIRPNKHNPQFKGKWTAPIITNPEYKGPWVAKNISNPNYVEDKTPSNFGKMGAIGFELWSMQNGFLFGNIYIGHSEQDAKKLADETWAVKNKIELLLKPKEEEKVEAGSSYVKKATDLGKMLQSQTMEFYDLAVNAKRPADAIKEFPHIVGLLGLITLMTFYLLSVVFMGSKKKVTKTEEKVEKVVKAEAKATGVETSKATKRAGKSTD